MYLEICLIIFGLAILVLVIFCIPVLMQLWRTTKDVAVTLETLNSSLPLILKNLEDITRNINSSTSAINQEVQNITGTIDRFQSVMKGIVDDIQSIAPAVMKLPVIQTVKNIVAVAKGIHAFMDVLLDKRSQRDN